MERSVTSLRVPPIFTGSNCLKSPPKINIFPSKGKSLFIKSRKALSTIFKVYLGAIGASSHIKTSVSLNN